MFTIALYLLAASLLFLVLAAASFWAFTHPTTKYGTLRHRLTDFMISFGVVASAVFSGLFVVFVAAGSLHYFFGA